MEQKLNVCLLNDSFPPLIDGVATCVHNYAKAIHTLHGNAIVCTPSFPTAVDAYPFPVIRYPSFRVTKMLSGYRAGYPFSPKLIDSLVKENIDIIHSHCPFSSGVVARVLREKIDKPLITTYHTKFDYEIDRLFTSKSMISIATKFFIGNIQTSDEVWSVSQGAAENLRQLGYQGDVQIIENGVDFPQGSATKEQLAALNKKHGLKEDDTVFLFIGRMIWYKGIKVMLDGLQKLKAQGKKFKMIFVGDGHDRSEIMQYATQCALNDHCIFTGVVQEREMLRVYFSRANLFLFPSDFDTNGIVVREAAACGTASMVLRDSCASEGITDYQNGILIEKTPEMVAKIAGHVCDDHALFRNIGQNAMNEIYLSWDEATARAYARYQIVLEKYKKEHHVRKGFVNGEDFFKLISFFYREQGRTARFASSLKKKLRNKKFRLKKRNK